MNAGTVIFRTDLDNKGLEKGLNNLSSNLKNIGSKMTIGLTAPITALVTGGVMYNAQIEQYQTGLTTLLGSSQEATNTISYLKQMAAKTPFETADLIKGTQTMLAFGMSLDDTKQALNMIGDVSMGNKDKFNSLSLAFAQVQSTGRLMGQDLLQMINQGFNPLQIISEKTGRSMASLKDDMEKGAISADMVTEAFKIATSEGGRFYGGMDAQSQTLTGKLSTLKDDFMTMVGTLTESLLPIITKVVEKISAFANWFSKLSPNTKTAILAVMGFVAILGPLISAIATVLGIITALATASVALNIGMLPLILTIGLIVAAIVAIGIAIYQIVKHWDTVKLVLGAMWGTVKSVFGKIGEFIGNIWGGIKKGFVNIINFIIKGINAMIAGFLAPINLLIKGWNATIGKVTGKIPQIKIAIPEIPKLANGGIILGSTIANVGEAGPEAVVPLNKTGLSNFLGGLGLSNKTIGSMGASYTPNIINNVNVNLEQDPLGRIVNQAKTFGNGSRLGYSYNGGLK